MNTLKRFFSYTIVRFIFSGGTAVSVYLSVLYVLVESAGLWYVPSSIIAFLTGFSVSFMLQKFWTFQDDRAMWHEVRQQLAYHFLLGVCSLIANTAFLYTLVEVFALWYFLGAIIAAGSVALFNFFIYRFFIFKSTRSASQGSGQKTVLIATGAYPPDIGGPATYSHLLMSELPNYGLKPTVVSFGAVKALPRMVRHAAYFFQVLIKGAEADIIFAQDPVSVGFPAFFAACLLGKKYVLKIVGDYAWEQLQVQSAKCKTKNKNEEFITLEKFQTQKFDFRTEARRKIEHFVAQHADMIIVPSEYLKKIILAWGVSREKIQVIHNSFDSPVERVPKESQRMKLGLEGSVLLSAGRLVPWKGFSALIEVVAQLKKDIPDIKLFIAGDGPDREKLEFQVSSFKFQDCFFLLGRLSHEKLLEYIQAADVFVLNTGYEGFSHQLLEVMALGTPVVTTAVGGNPELIENQKDGLLVSYNDRAGLRDAIMLVLKNEYVRNRIIENGRKKAESFSKKRMLESLIKVV